MDADWLAETETAADASMTVTDKGQSKVEVNTTHDPKEIERALAEYNEAIAPVLADLSKAGFDVDFVAQLEQKRLDYRSVIPLLLTWLPRIENRKAKMDIVRALAVKWARPVAARPLIEEFRRAASAGGDLNLQWTMGDALTYVADESVFEDLVDLALDRRHGRAREMIAVALGNMRDPRAVDVLIELLSDEEVAGHAIIGLGKLKAKKARPHVEPFLSHPKAWVRQEAKRAIAKIDKAK